MLMLLTVQGCCVCVCVRVCVCVCVVVMFHETVFLRSTESPFPKHIVCMTYITVFKCSSDISLIKAQCNLNTSRRYGLVYSPHTHRHTHTHTAHTVIPLAAAPQDHVHRALLLPASAAPCESQPLHQRTQEKTTKV